MLAIRLQRTGRKGHPQYRMIVQDSQFSPKSGRVVFMLGSFDPHTKQANLDTDKAAKYLANGAQPSDRAAKILTEAGVKMPKWYSPQPISKKSIKNPEKLRKNRPEGAEPAAKAASVEEAEEKAEPAEDSESVEATTPAEDTTPAEESNSEPAPADEPQESDKSAEGEPTAEEKQPEA